MVEIRRSYNRLFSTTGFPILVRRHLVLNRGLANDVALCVAIIKTKPMCMVSLTLIFTRSVDTLQHMRPLGRVGSK